MNSMMMTRSQNQGYHSELKLFLQYIPSRNNNITKCLLDNHGCTEGSLLVGTVLRLQEQVPLCAEIDFAGTFQQLVAVAVQYFDDLYGLCTLYYNASQLSFELLGVKLMLLVFVVILVAVVLSLVLAQFADPPAWLMALSEQLSQQLK